MEEFIIYLLKSGLWLLTFGFIYLIFFKKETFYKFNRYFLLSGLIFSFILPFCQYYYKVEIFSSISNGAVTNNLVSDHISGYGLKEWILISYVIISIILIARHLISLLKIRRYTHIHKPVRHESYKLVDSNDLNQPFSLFNYLFINTNSISETEKNLIILHEQAHIRQKHWIDLIIAEIVCIIQWFNPVAWLYIRFIKENHEFLADKEVLNNGNSVATYQAVLINQNFNHPVFSFSNSFAYSNKFKRINMMKKQASGSAKKLAVLFLVPALGLFLWAFSKPEYVVIAQQDNHQKTNVAISIVTDSIPKDSVIVIGYKAMTDGESIQDIITSPPPPPPLKGEVVNVSITQHTISDEMPDSARTKAASDINDKVNIQIHKREDSNVSVTSINNPPLFILDGEEIEDISNISPSDIESISVLKDASASSIYGEKGKNGVVIITSKKSQGK